jgi:hypothetical protein
VFKIEKPDFPEWSGLDSRVACSSLELPGSVLFLLEPGSDAADAGVVLCPINLIVLRSSIISREDSSAKHAVIALSDTQEGYSYLA